MTFVDMIILVFVLLILSSIIYFRFVKRKSVLGCNCSMKNSCSLKIENIKAIFEEIQS